MCSLRLACSTGARCCKRFGRTKKGDFSVRLPMDLIGIDGEIASAFNDVVELNEMFSDKSYAFVTKSAKRAGFSRE
jgi:hypothetical protein